MVHMYSFDVLLTGMDQADSFVRAPVPATPPDGRPHAVPNRAVFWSRIRQQRGLLQVQVHGVYTLVHSAIVLFDFLVSSEAASIAFRMRNAAHPIASPVSYLDTRILGGIILAENFKNYKLTEMAAPGQALQLTFCRTSVSNQTSSTFVLSAKFWCFFLLAFSVSRQCEGTRGFGRLCFVMWWVFFF